MPILHCPGRDDPGTVRADQAHRLALEKALHAHHVEHRNALGDADDQRHAGVGGFHDRVGGERRRHVDDRGVGAGRRHRLRDRVEDRNALEVVPPLPGVTPATICVPYSWHARVWSCPVAPVMPCVTTRVFLLTSTLTADPRSDGAGSRHLTAKLRRVNCSARHRSLRGRAPWRARACGCGAARPPKGGALRGRASRAVGGLEPLPGAAHAVLEADARDGNRASCGCARSTPACGARRRAARRRGCAAASRPSNALEDADDVEQRVTLVARDVEHFAADAGRGQRQPIGLHDVVDVGEVARLLAVAVDLERLVAAAPRA